MSQQPVARLGDGSSHGGTIISAGSTITANGIRVARVGDMHACPIPGHGVTPIITGSGNYRCEGMVTAVVGSVVGCGAVITGGSPDTFAPLESPSGDDIGVLGPDPNVMILDQDVLV